MWNKSEAIHNNDFEGCIHHWLIDSRNLGYCKKCGASMQFLPQGNSYTNQKAWSRRSIKTLQNVLKTKNQ